MADDFNIERGTVTTSDANAALRVLQGVLWGDEVRDNLEHMEPFGFSSEPLLDGKTDAIVLFMGSDKGRGMVLSVSDRRYRITGMKAGETAIYDNKGRHVYLKEDGIEIEGKDSPITVHTTSSVTVTASANVNVIASSATIDAPTTTITGTLTVNGEIVGQGGLKVSGGNGATVDGSLITTEDVTANGVSLIGHKHTGDSGGTTSAPI